MSDPRSYNNPLPKEWDTQLAKRLFRQRIEKNHPREEILSASQMMGVVPQRLLEQETDRQVMTATKGFENFNLVKCGDFVISLRSFEGGVEYSPFQGIISPAYSVMKPSEQVVHPYFRYLLKSREFISRLQAVTTGIRDGKTVRYSEFAELALPLPPENIQRAIADFLDRETVRIDDLVAKKQRQIELLQEKRAAVISHAVTKGLNPDAKMKDSGIEWLGEIPEHWESTRIKNVSSFITSGPRGWSEFFSEEGDLFLQSGNLNDELGLTLDEVQRVDPPKGAEGIRTALNVEDVLVCVTGAKTGRVAIVDVLPEKMYINQHLALIRPKKDIADPYFLGMSLGSVVGQTHFGIVQYGLKTGLGLNNVSEAPIFLPPLPEQRQLVKHLKDQVGAIDNLFQTIRRSMGLLHEYRSSLISAAVTGKIDVRGEAAA
ncbi:MAG: restriction endonuclease subunit S [Proteobacteria bacterium]|nr:restriction endonuclease subunit S [Pseudomonadota bacterium]MBU4382429.1 restriction endonuclease subunit S [Pseudomonadota bacterium]MCG2763998.1 restriction endonuclease subunit S [Desulfarculaceae bacterium]